MKLPPSSLFMTVWILASCLLPCCLVLLYPEAAKSTWLSRGSTQFSPVLTK